MRVDKKRKQYGFTLIELIVAVALGIVVLTVIYSTFRSQHDSYYVQNQVSMTQQNIRAALYLITRDVQMAGHYTSLVDKPYLSDWDDSDTTSDTAIRPLIYLANDVSGFEKVKDNTDVLVIIKASDKSRDLVFGESATPGNSSTAGLVLTSWDDDGKTRDARDLDGDGRDNDLSYYSGAGHSKYGILVKKDLTRAELFEVDSADNFVFGEGLTDEYSEGDSIHKLDVIMYAIDNSDPAHPTLVRKNIGTDNSFSVIAEDIDNLQFEFILNDGSIVKNLDALSNIPLVRAVKVYILARSEKKVKGHIDKDIYEIGSVQNYRPNDGYLRRLLSSTIKTRNIGD